MSASGAHVGHIVDAFHCRWIAARGLLTGREADPDHSASFVVFCRQDGRNVTGAPAYYRGPLATCGVLLSAIEDIPRGGWALVEDAIARALPRARWWRVSAETAQRTDLGTKRT